MTMLVYMVGRNIPLYGIDIDAYSNVNVDAQSILLQAISGDMKNCSIFIIGLWPYMLASMLAILIVAIMSLDNTRKLSPKKINIWTVTIMMISQQFRHITKHRHLCIELVEMNLYGIR